MVRVRFASEAFTENQRVKERHKDEVYSQDKTRPSQPHVHTQMQANLSRNQQTYSTGFWWAGLTLFKGSTPVVQAWPLGITDRPTFYLFQGSQRSHQVG